MNLLHERRLLMRAALTGAVVLLEPFSAAPQPTIPHLERRGAATQLIVDGKPFLVLAGELYNNSATSLEFMQPVWPRLNRHASEHCLGAHFVGAAGALRRQVRHTRKLTP
jgi:hypothetical protein